MIDLRGHIYPTSGRFVQVLPPGANLNFLSSVCSNDRIIYSNDNSSVCFTCDSYYRFLSSVLTGQ